MFKILYFYIFNRSSINICSKNSIKPYFKFYFGWDGFYKNKMAESGPYIWQLQFTNLFNSKKELINGNLNLLR